MRLLALILLAIPALAQTAGSAMPWVKPQFFTSGGSPASGYKACFWVAGTNSPQTTYSDSGLIHANTNPVVLDASGRASIFFSANSYKVALLVPTSTTTDCVTGTMNFVWSQDNIANNADLLRAATGAAYIGFEQAGSSVARTVQAKLYESISALDFGADPTGAADSTTALSSALSAASGKALLLNPGTYKVSQLTVPANTQVFCIGPATLFEGNGLAVNTTPVLKLNSGDTLLGPCTIDGNISNQTATEPPDIGFVTAASNVRIDGWTVKNCQGPGIYAHNSGGSLNFSNITSTYTGHNNSAAIFVLIDNGTTISNVTITNLNADQSGHSLASGGVKVLAQNSSTINRVEVNAGSIVVGDGGSTASLGVEYFADATSTINGGTLSAMNIIAENTTNTMIGCQSFGGNGGDKGMTATGNTFKNCNGEAGELIGNNLALIGNTVDHAGPIAAQSPGGTVSNLKVDKNTFLNGQNATGDIQFFASSGNTIQGATADGNTFTNSASIPIIFNNSGGTMTGCSASNNLIVAAGTYGIATAAGVTKCKFADNTMLLSHNGTGVAGISVQGDYSDIEGNLIDGSNGNCVLVNGANYATLRNNTCNNTLGNALQLSGTQTGTEIQYNTATNTTGYDLFLGSATNIYFGRNRLASAAPISYGSATFSAFLMDWSSTFTPSIIGWYRILTTSLQDAGGSVQIYAPPYDNTRTDVEFQFNCGAFSSTPCAINQTRFAAYNGGVVDQVRLSTDGSSNVYADIHIATATTPQPVTVYMSGPAIRGVVPSPVVGATVGSTNVTTLTLGPGLLSTAGLQSGAYTFATLPVACSSAALGTMYVVTDSNTVTWGATIAGSSTNKVLAFCDGTNYTVAGK